MTLKELLKELNSLDIETPDYFHLPLLLEEKKKSTMKNKKRRDFVSRLFYFLLSNIFLFRTDFFRFLHDNEYNNSFAIRYINISEPAMLASFVLV